MRKKTRRKAHNLNKSITQDESKKMLVFSEMKKMHQISTKILKYAKNANRQEILEKCKSMRKMKSSALS